MKNIESAAVSRFHENPLITRKHFEMIGRPDAGDNINGPSVIPAPPWITNPLGKYYMYFAHHSGDHIRLATADSVRGPWKLYAGTDAVLALGDGIAVARGQAQVFGHIASPDVHLDLDAETVRMYFHGPVVSSLGVEFAEQKTVVAESADGLDFGAGVHDGILGGPYFRAFTWDHTTYAISLHGDMWRAPESDRFTSLAPDPLADAWTRGPNPLRDAVRESDADVFPRHSAVHVEGSMLWVYFSCVGHTPERILRAVIELGPDWRRWRVVQVDEVISPENPYEGGDLAPTRGVGGAQTGVCQLRDPAILVEADRTYLFYAVRGEEGIAGAELL